MKKFLVATILLTLFIAYCAYATAFFAWMTATPVAPENLRRAQMLAQAWLSGFFLGILLLIAVIVRMIQLRRRKKKGR